MITKDEMAEMTEEQLAAKLEEMLEEKAKTASAQLKSELEDEIETLKAKLDEYEKGNSELEDKVEKQGVALKQMRNSEVKPKTEMNILSELRTQSEALGKMKDAGTGRIQLKSMTMAGNAPTYSQGLVDMSLTRLPERRPFMQDILSRGALPKAGKVIWFEQDDRNGDAGPTGEGLLKNTMSFDVVEKTENAKKVTAFIKVSREMLNDIEFMESEIRGDLLRRVDLNVDSQLITGNGAGSNLLGVKENAVAFDAAPYAAAVVAANRFDVLALAVTQVYKQDFVPSHILLNPGDVAFMDVTKGVDGQYVLPSFVSRDGMEIKSTPIIINNGVTAGEYLVMDSSKATVFTAESLNLSIGYENDDFTKNMVTVLAEWRGVNRIKNNEYGAFVKGVFATDIAAIAAA